MSGDAFVVGDGFVVDQRTLRKVRGGDDDPARAFTARSAGDVVGCWWGLEWGDGFDRHRRFWKQGEQLRKLRLHLCNVVTKILENLLRGSWKVLGIGFQRCAEGGEVGEAFFLRNDKHLTLDAVDLAQTNLVYFVRGHVGRGPAVDVVLVASFPVWQRLDGESGAACGSVIRTEKRGEGFVGGNVASGACGSDLGVRAFWGVWRKLSGR